MKTSYVAAIDQGTTSSRFIVFDEAGKIVAMHQLEFPQIHPQAGWAEHDPEEIFKSVTTCMDATYQKMKEKGLSPDNVRAIGITNQRETTVVWDKVTGKPLYNAL
ncbi:Glycerol kinase, partial [Quaeritorhiza haematococci]